jgi:predicted ATPase
MLEPVRQYALEKLEEGDEAPTTRGRHAEHFVALAEEARPELMGASHAAWLEHLEREHDNLREALRWTRESGDAELGFRLVGSLYDHVQEAAHDEAQQDRPRDHHVLPSRVTRVAGPDRVFGEDHGDL